MRRPVEVVDLQPAAGGQAGRWAGPERALAREVPVNYEVLEPYFGYLIDN